MAVAAESFRSVKDFERRELTSAIDDADLRALRREVGDLRAKRQQQEFVIAALRRQVADKDAIIRWESEKRKAAEAVVIRSLRTATN